MKAIDCLIKFHGKERSTLLKIVSLLCGMIFFLVILPALFILAGNFISSPALFKLNQGVEYVLSAISITFGLFMLIWTTGVQWKTGKGTPAPNAPTQHLVVSGPYRWCRNPIELGAIFYYLGIGTLHSGIAVGLFCFAAGFTVGSLYHKFIEEKELELRFGDEYNEYKKTTPFLFPGLRR